MNRYEFFESLICDWIISPIFICGLIVTFLFWLILIGIIYPLTQLTFLIHKMEKKHRKEDEEFDAELDEKIKEIQEKAENEIQ